LRTANFVFADGTSKYLGTARHYGVAVAQAHPIVDPSDYPGSDHAGTRITKALAQFNVSPVNADGSTTGASPTNCS
jgi:hypothetical protein